MSDPEIIQTADILEALAEGPRTMTELLTETEPPLLVEGLVRGLKTLLRMGFVEVEGSDPNGDGPWQLTNSGRRFLDAETEPDALYRKDAAGGESTEIAGPTTHVSSNFVAASVTIAIICGVWELLGDGPPWNFAVAAHLVATIVITVRLRKSGASQ